MTIIIKYTYMYTRYKRADLIIAGDLRDDIVSMQFYKKMGE